LLPDSRPPRDDLAAGPDEDLASRIDPLRPVVPTDDLKTPLTKDQIIAEAEKEVLKNNKLYQRESSPTRNVQQGARRLDPRS